MAVPINGYTIKFSNDVFPGYPSVVELRVFTSQTKLNTPEIDTETGVTTLTTTLRNDLTLELDYGTNVNILRIPYDEGAQLNVSEKPPAEQIITIIERLLNIDSSTLSNLTRLCLEGIRDLLASKISIVSDTEVLNAVTANFQEITISAINDLKSNLLTKVNPTQLFNTDPDFVSIIDTVVDSLISSNKIVLSGINKEFIVNELSTALRTGYDTYFSSTLPDLYSADISYITSNSGSYDISRPVSAVQVLANRNTIDPDTLTTEILAYLASKISAKDKLQLIQ
jgi:hypothetical protein